VAGNGDVVHLAGRLDLTSGYATSATVAVADANYTVVSTDHTVRVTSLTATRTLTIPNAATLVGRRLVI
ncbi:hypothetical protein, partial [Staphylococcus aureus]|uniref:hypothetical protein n=1 Tax=Staphylococcus aureus TaxID=1280 RepID=UPI001E434D21